MRLHVSVTEVHQVPSSYVHYVHQLEVIGNLPVWFPMETWTSRNLLEILKSGRPKPEGPHIIIKSTGYFSKGDILLREASTQE